MYLLHGYCFIVGENAGRPSRGVAETTVGIQTGPAGTANFLSHATQVCKQHTRHITVTVFTHKYLAS